MELAKKDMLRQRQLAPIGNVLSDFSHSIQSCLAPVRESAGWLRELLGQECPGLEDDREKFADILLTIEKQINILVQKSEHLNRFAQRMFTAFSIFEPGEIVEEAVSFTSRFAYLRNVSISSEIAETLPALYSDPVRINFLISILINDMLEKTESGGKIVLRTKPIEEEGVLIEVEGYGVSEDVAPVSDEGNQYRLLCQQVLADLGGRLEITAIGHDRRLASLFLPIEIQSKTTIIKT